MDIPEKSDENIADYMARRRVARETLKKIIALVAVWKEEERQRVALVKIAPWILLWVFAIALVILPLLLAAFESHPKIKLFAGSILLGIVGAIALTLWSRRNGKN